MPSACLALPLTCPVCRRHMPGAILYLSHTVPSKTAGHNIFIYLFIITASHSTVRTPANPKREGVSQPRQGREKGRRRKKEPAWISSDCNKMRNTKSKSRRDKALKKAEGRKVLSSWGSASHAEYAMKKGE